MLCSALRRSFCRVHALQQTFQKGNLRLCASWTPRSPSIPSACDDDGGDSNLVASSRSLNLDGIAPENPTDREWCGPAHPVSNIRRMRLPVPEDASLETNLQRKLRLMKESANQWHHEFWEKHNTEFQEGKKAWAERMSKSKAEADSAESRHDEGAVASESMSIFYKEFLDKNWERHAEYNWAWYKKNAQLILLSTAVNLERVLLLVTMRKL